jgi:hypothetical protein
MTIGFRDGDDDDFLYGDSRPDQEVPQSSNGAVAHLEADAEASEGDEDAKGDIDEVVVVDNGDDGEVTAEESDDVCYVFPHYELIYFIETPYAKGRRNHFGTSCPIFGL